MKCESKLLTNWAASSHQTVTTLELSSVFRRSTAFWVRYFHPDATSAPVSPPSAGDMLTSTHLPARMSSGETLVAWDTSSLTTPVLNTWRTPIPPVRMLLRVLGSLLGNSLSQ